MKIAFIIGTRPEIIKMSPLIDEVDKRDIDYILIHTGQHYDQEMSDQFFLDLELPQPDYNIGVGSTTHGKQTAVMLEGIEKILQSERPDIVLVEGDTNAVMAGALAAAKMHISLGHVESGLRSYDKTMPEEINRIVADVCSSLFFVPTEESAVNLIFEGLNSHDIFITGNTVVDAVIRNLKIAKKRSSFSDIDLDEKFITLTLHRAENVDDEQRLVNITNALLEIKGVNIIFPVHPRTVKNLQKFGLYDNLDKAEHIKLIKPVGYLDFLLLLSNTQLVITDSGGIQEEAITLKIPCVTLRYNTERPETVHAGGNILVGTNKNLIIDTVNRIISDEELYLKMSQAINPYGDGKTSEKILDIILNAYKQDDLTIKSPDNIEGLEGRYLQRIEDDLDVRGYERENPHLRIIMVFEDNRTIFPHEHLNLKNKMFVVEKFNSNSID
ncbi:MAG: UDP-N-acetylglucosamine 2-epimerase (non-hydrolyzing) [Methanobacterium sp.]|nr:UDP-N-acetylglucosamine 2-epimerase (non-hydrolyzing) [Methanobacterium sp.]